MNRADLTAITIGILLGAIFGLLVAGPAEQEFLNLLDSIGCLPEDGDPET